MINKELLTNYLMDLSCEESIELWNLYCEKNQYYGEYIYENDADFLNNNFGSLEDLADALDGNDDYRWRDDYAKMDDNMNIHSSNGPWNDDDWIDYDALCDWLIQEDDWSLLFKYNLEDAYKEDEEEDEDEEDE